MKFLVLLSLVFANNVFAASFEEVWGVISTPTPENKIYVQDLPERKVGLEEMLKSPGDIYEATKRSLTDESDLFPKNTLKLIRPNGICLSGKWVITRDTKYTGYFAKGSEGLVIGRASVNYSKPQKGEYRSFGFAGKLFPTLDKKKNVKTANFFLIDDNGGTKETNFMRAPLLSEAKLSKFNIIKSAISNFSIELIRMLKLAEKAQTEADQESKVRQLYPISEVGLAALSLAKTPALIKLQGAPEMKLVETEDFRQELRTQLYDRKLRLNIYLAETRAEEPAWDPEPVGYMEFDQDSVSDACDLRLRFHHPWWRVATK